MRLKIFRWTLCLVGVAAVLNVGLHLPAQSQPESQKSSGPASRARPIPAVDFHIPWMGMKIFGMHAESNKAILGKPTAQPADLRYFYLPLFAFQKKGTGELDVTVSDAGEITLPIIYDSEEVRKAVRSYLVSQKLISSDAMDGHVQTVAAKMWYLETKPGYEPKVRFGPFENFQFGYKDLLQTRVPPDHARKFVRDLKAGEVSLQATIVFDGYTYQDNSIVITADDILNTDQYRKLAGPGGKGVVGRHQVARLLREACLTRNVAVTSEYHDPDFNDLVKTIIMNYAQKESKPVADWNAVEAFFKDGGWDPNDFKADLIEAAKMNQNKDFRNTFSQEIQKSGEGGGGLNVFGIFSVGGSGKSGEVQKVFNEVCDKWSINTEFSGKQYIPKSINVYTMNAATIRRASAFAVGKRKKTVSDGILTVAVNPNDNALHTKATPAYEERLAQEIAAVTKELEKLRGDTLRLKIVPHVYMEVEKTAGAPPSQHCITATQGGSGARILEHKICEVDGEVVATIMVPHARLAELADFWGYEAKVDQKNPSQVNVFATGIRPGACVHFMVYVIYRSKKL